MKKTNSKAAQVVRESLVTDLESQHAYVEQISKQGERGYALIAANTFVQGMRDSGYKSTATAIDEFADNSFQSGANRIDIVYSTADKGKNIDSIAVIDDGHGMEPGMIRAAVLWGGTHRFNDRTGFGRYGFGLPSAAVSIAQQYEVFSKVEDGDWHKVRIDLREIAEGKLTTKTGLILAPEPAKTSLPPFVSEALGKREIKSGTVIHLVAPDRLSSGFRRPQSFEQKMLEHLGLIYRGTLRLCEMFVNGTRVEPVDPLFLDPNARYYDVGNGYKAESQPSTEFKLANSRGEEGSVRLRFSYMHPFFQRTKDGKVEKARLGVIKENNAYLIVTRAGRQIDLVNRTHFPKDADNITIVNYDRNWAIELDFDPILDEEFGITVNKQQVTLSERVWQKLADEKLPVIVKGLRSKFKKEIEDAKEPEDKQQRVSEEVMKEAAKFATRPKNKPSDKKQERARENAAAEAKKKSEETKEPEETVAQGLLEEYTQNPFVIDFESLEGAPFYRVEQYGPQARVWINRRHRFYTDVYNSVDGRLRSALELLLFVLGTCELESEGDRELFYSVERTEWSRRLETTLSLLDRHVPIDDVGSAAAEAREIAVAESQDAA
jgi:Histidine kinase-, DNA gyrase B-, and HSP90-like ATPase